ncbi:MAG TPA: hypothetical protein VHL09_06450 [Dehalococcoidia bacterium]|nr:hypothetical protein [Dehalococcoidia bacterium]
MPNTYGHSIVIGIFDDPSLAERALDDLRIAGLDESRFGLATPQGGANGTGVNTGIVAQGFAGLGLPSESAQQYDQELRAGRSIIAVQPGPAGAGGNGDRPPVAEILRRNGARHVSE